MHNLFNIRTRREIETHRRINVLVAAYGYEFESSSHLTDGEFDEECRKINLSMDTGRPDLDAWFRANFNAHTGSWIGSFPELNRIKELYHAHYTRR